MKPKPKDYTARLVIKDVDKLKKREINQIISWLKCQAAYLAKDWEQYPDHYTGTLMKR